VIAEHHDIAEAMVKQRPLLGGDPASMTLDGLARSLHQEEAAERVRDAAYWKPLRERLEQLRRAARQN
jgi:hypothetical protein